jgi:hypothetical protein
VDVSVYLYQNIEDFGDALFIHTITSETGNIGTFI